MLAEGSRPSSGVGAVKLQVDVTGRRRFVRRLFSFGEKIVKPAGECGLMSTMASQGIRESLVASRTTLLKLGQLFGQVKGCRPRRGRRVLNDYGRDGVDRENALAAGTRDFERFHHAG